MNLAGVRKGDRHSSDPSAVRALPQRSQKVVDEGTGTSSPPTDADESLVGHTRPPTNPKLFSSLGGLIRKGDDSQLNAALEEAGTSWTGLRGKVGLVSQCTLLHLCTSQLPGDAGWQGMNRLLEHHGIPLVHVADDVRGCMKNGGTLPSNTVFFAHANPCFHTNVLFYNSARLDPPSLGRSEWKRRSG
jgi:hypothetical protein